MHSRPPILIEQMRGDSLETYHTGSIAISNANGDLLFAMGNSEARPLTRSSMKPIQALPFVEVWSDRVSLEEIAIASASHSGEDMHRRLVARLLDRFGGTPDQLQCGVHPPHDEETRRELIREGLTPTVLHHNCSGKHAAMLATANSYGESLEGYYLPEHPVQQRIKARIARYCDDAMDEIATGMDHCSVVTWGPTLRGMATAFARIADQSGRFGDDVGRIRDAMQTHPEIIAGTRKRIDTDLMRACKGLIAKAGAAGYYSMGWHDAATGMGVGVAIKMWDGEEVPRNVVSCILLETLGLLQHGWGAKTGWGARTVKNWAGRAVGEIRPSKDFLQGLQKFTTPVRMF
ncbi:MAG: asparaginase [bacterium]|nr:asparaginase [bacterium]